METTTCQGTNRRGEPCSATPQENGWCFFHDPDREGDRRASARRGGKARQGRTISTPGGGSVTLRTVDDVLSYLEEIAGNLATLENSVARAGAQCRVAQQALAAIVDHELEQRLEALEGVIHGDKAA